MKIEGKTLVTLDSAQVLVGDPCYVFNNESWDAITSAMFPPGGPDNRKALMELRGDDGTIIGALVPTCYGDGCYPGKTGHDYGVDSGMLAVLALSDAAKAHYTDPSGEGLVKEFDLEGSGGPWNVTSSVAGCLELRRGDEPVETIFTDYDEPVEQSIYGDSHRSHVEGSDE